MKALSAGGKSHVFLIFLEKKREREKKKKGGLCTSDLSDVKALSGKGKKVMYF